MTDVHIASAFLLLMCLVSGTLAGTSMRPRHPMRVRRAAAILTAMCLAGAVVAAWGLAS